MSDSLPENSFSGILRVLKLVTGEEIVGLLNESMPEKITIQFPANMLVYTNKDAEGNIVEYVKLSNYLASIKRYEISIPRSAIVYVGEPNVELEKMYEVYLIAMQTDPNSLLASHGDGFQSTEHGLNLLNELFNNEDFVSFVNDLIENFEGVEILSELDGDDSEEEQQNFSNELVEEEPEPKPKKKKRSRMKPEGSRMPYKPESPPEDPQSWSDNPFDYT